MLLSFKLYSPDTGAGEPLGVPSSTPGLALVINFFNCDLVTDAVKGI